MSGPGNRWRCGECRHVSLNLKFCLSPKLPRFKKGACTCFDERAAERAPASIAPPALRTAP